MKWTIQQLRESKGDILKFSETFAVESQLKEKSSAIIAAPAVKASGYFSYSIEDIILHGQIDAQLILESTRTLEPVEISLTIPIKERYVDSSKDGHLDEYEETTLVLEEDYIDLEEVVVELIVTNIPMKVYSLEEDDQSLPQGEDWHVVTEEDLLTQRSQKIAEEGDPRFQVLQQLLDKDEV